MKKNILKLTLFFATTQTSLFSAGIPVIDAASIAQAVTNYSQMLKDYSQMLKDTMNFEKQMKEFGVDMDSISEIYGNTLSLINTATDLYEDINDIPKDIYGELAKIQNTCTLLKQMQGADNIKEAISKGKQIERRFNGCLNAINNTTAITDDIIKKTEEINEIRKDILNNGDSGEKTQKIAQLEIDIRNLNQIRTYANNIKKNEANIQLMSKLDKISEFDSKSHSEKLKSFTNQMAKSNNAKQAQALTNSLLLELIQQQQKIFELHYQYYQVELAEKNSMLGQIKEPKLEKQNLKDLKNSSSYFQEYIEKGKQIQFTEAGIPIFIP